MGRISLKVRPGSSKVGVEKIGDEIKIKLHSHAEGGKANKELIEFLSKKLKVPKRDITIVKGQTSKNKIIEINGLSEDEILRGLLK